MSELIPDALPEGTQIARGVVLGPAIARGSWGIVYEAEHPAWGRVAVKEYLPTLYATRGSMSHSGSLAARSPRWQEAVRRGAESFRREADSLRRLRHRNVVPVFDLIEDRGTLFLVMEFIQGESLEAVATDPDFLEPQNVMVLGEILIEALAAIHAEGILHRDISPDNIIITDRGLPVLIDFGAAAAEVGMAARSSRGVVKDGYSPPEQYDEAGEATAVGPWSDIYATAAVLYRLAAGRLLPQDEPDPPSAQTRLSAVAFRNRPDPLQPLCELQPPGYPREWLAAVDAGLTLDYRERPPTAEAWYGLFAGAGSAAAQGVLQRAEDGGGGSGGVSAAAATGSSERTETQPGGAAEASAEVTEAEMRLGLALLGGMVAVALILMFGAGYRLYTGPYARAERAIARGSGQEAVSLLTKAAAGDDGRADVKLGELLMEGTLVAPDLKRAEQLFQQALARDAANLLASRRLAEAKATQLVGLWGTDTTCAETVRIDVQVDASKAGEIDAPFRQLKLQGQSIYTARIDSMQDAQIVAVDDANAYSYFAPSGDTLIWNPGPQETRLTRCVEAEPQGAS